MVGVELGEYGAAILVWLRGLRQFRTKSRSLRQFPRHLNPAVAKHDPKPFPQYMRRAVEVLNKFSCPHQRLITGGMQAYGLLLMGFGRPLGDLGVFRLFPALALELFGVSLTKLLRLRLLSIVGVSRLWPSGLVGEGSWGVLVPNCSRTR